MKKIAGILLLLVLLGASSAQANTIFWTENFENHLFPNWLGACESPSAASPDLGCGNNIETSYAHSQTHALVTHYDPTGADLYLNQAGSFMDRCLITGAGGNCESGTQNQWLTFWIKFTNFTVGRDETKVFISYGDGAGVYWSIVGPGATGGSSNGQFETTVTMNGTQNCLIGEPNVQCPYPSNMGAHKSLFDNHWHCVETHVTSNGTGTVEIFVDGEQTLGYYNQPFATGTIDAVRRYAQYGQGDLAVDDIVVSDFRLPAGQGGCGGNVLAPPTGLKVN